MAYLITLNLRGLTVDSIEISKDGEVLTTSPITGPLQSITEAELWAVDFVSKAHKERTPAVVRILHHQLDAPQSPEDLRKQLTLEAQRRIYEVITSIMDEVGANNSFGIVLIALGRATGGLLQSLDPVRREEALAFLVDAARKYYKEATNGNQ